MTEYRIPLSATARETLKDVEELLKARFTGQIILDCHQGGVTMFTETKRRRPGKA